MAKTSTIIVGTGGMARHHMNVMLTMSNTNLCGLVEVAEEQRQLTRDLFEKHGKKCPPFYGTIRELLRRRALPIPPSSTRHTSFTWKTPGTVCVPAWMSCSRSPW